MAIHIYPANEKEIYHKWRATLTGGVLSSRHLLLASVGNIVAYVGIYALTRACGNWGAPRWEIWSGALAVGLAIALAGYYMFQLYRRTRNQIVSPNASEEQINVLLNVSYIGFRLYFVMLMVVGCLANGIVAIWRR